ncbi:MAG: ABC transporter substrate-binding protein [Chloroflexota bacterium]|nr:ABC transporter substrate-binding protein [Chloroflexota bacterium]
MLRKLIFVGVAFATLSLGGAALAQEDVPVVGFMQFVSHPALNAGRDGAVAALNAAGFVDGATARFIFANGEGDIPTLATIAQSFLDEEVDLIIATSTPAAQAALNATLPQEGPPVIYNVVTSPYGAGLAEKECVHPAWMTGTQALAPYADTVPLIFDIVPDADTVGYIYNTAEANSVANTDILTPLFAELGLAMEVQTISTSAEVATAAEALVGRDIDVFYVATDSTVVAGLEALIQVANENGIPVIASDPSSAARGAVLAQGLDYTQEGQDAGRMAVAFLNGELDLATARISRQTVNLLAINLDAAVSQGVTVPDALLERAGIVIEGGETSMAEAATMTDDERMAADTAFIAGLACSEDEITEQLSEIEGG